MKKFLTAALVILVVMLGIYLSVTYIDNMHYMIVSIMAIGTLGILIIGKDL